MKTKKHYPELSSKLKRRFLEICKKNEIDYKSLWADSRKSLLRKRITKCREDIREQASAYLFILDFCLIWFVKYTDVLAISFFSVSIDKKADRKHNVITLICWRICAEIIAIRKLVLEGLDVPAKQILRAMSENLDALGLAALSEEFCEDFVNDQEVEHANKTWYKHISKGKARKLIQEGLPLNIRDIIDELEMYRDQEEKVLSAAAHPSYISSFVSLFPEFDENRDSDNIGISSVFSPFSLRTLRYCAYRLLMHCVYDIVLFKTYERYIQELEYEPTLKVKKFIKNGRDASIFIIQLFNELDEQNELTSHSQEDVLS